MAGDSVGIEIDRLVSSIENMMPRDLFIWSKCCIFKTPSIFYRHNKRAYIPDAFSIGPLHHGSPNLKATEKIKAMYLQGLISRLNSPELLRILIVSIIEVEKDARACYAETIDHYNSEQLVKILVVDGCFIIELFRKSTYQRLRGLGDPIFSRPNMLQFLDHDLILLENQVPWMVLERLFNLTMNSCDDENPLTILAMKFFEDIQLSRRMPPRDQVINIKDIEHFVDLFKKISIISSTDTRPGHGINIECIKRFVDLFRKLATLSSSHFRKLTTSSSTLFRKLSILSMFRISSIEEDESRREWELILLPSATSLVEAGIKFKRGLSETVLEVKFNNGILEIPPLEIHDITETVFRNLISYEHCHPYSFDNYRITSYAVLLDSLINTSKDIDILCENKIFNNGINPEDAAQLFNKLCIDTCVDREDYHYTKLSREVNSFCRRRWPRWRAVLTHKYFNTPWAFISTLAAFILLVLTLLQTVYTMKN